MLELMGPSTWVCRQADLESESTGARLVLGTVRDDLALEQYGA